jgi:outer membrane protein OmpA-like peptidoglycan-associated protein
MEQRFGADFSGVRVHDDARAAESARAVDAHAYTVGSDIVFAPGRYAPGTSGGDRLLAHELAHVVQDAPRTLARKEAADPGRGLGLHRGGGARVLRRQVSCDSPTPGGKCCFACPKPPGSPPHRCCDKTSLDFVQQSEKSGDAIANKAWERWAAVESCPGDDPRVKALLARHFKVDTGSADAGTQVKTINAAFDKIVSMNGVIPDCEPKVATGGTDDAKVAAGWRPLTHPMCFDFFPPFFEKARAARAPITIIHEKAHSLAGKDDGGGYEGDPTYPGADAAAALRTADPYANFMRDLARLPTAPKCGSAPAPPSPPPPQHQGACGPAEIGPAPPGCTPQSVPLPAERFLFNPSCDEFAPGEEARLRGFADAHAGAGAVTVVGMASSDGAPSFNDALSCRRAEAGRAVLEGAGVVPASVVATGPVPGTANDPTVRAVGIESAELPEPGGGPDVTDWFTAGFW